jgi:hypothetical protein
MISKSFAVSEGVENEVNHRDATNPSRTVATAVITAVQTATFALEPFSSLIGVPLQLLMKSGVF